MNKAKLKETADAVLDKVVNGGTPSPGVVAIVTDREGSIYEGVVGERELGGGTPMTTDTVGCIMSCTKSVAATVALKLVEEGKLDLDRPAKEYLPEIGEIQVLDGFDDDGQPKVRPPKRDITMRMLLLHTSGFAYDVFNKEYDQIINKNGRPHPVMTALRESLDLPLLFDPGERWEYGYSSDWAGLVTGAVGGKRVSELMRELVLEKLGMEDTSFVMSESMTSRLAPIHARTEDGGAVPTEIVLPQEPEVDICGSSLYSTAEDYAKFMRMWLNDGSGPGGQVLKPETIELGAKPGLGDQRIRKLESFVPMLSNDADFFPGVEKSFSPAFMVNLEDAPTGRPANSLAWAGATNVYYWIDRTNGIAGFWLMQVLPFFDANSVNGYLDFEKATYDALNA